MFDREYSIERMMQYPPSPEPSRGRRCRRKRRGSMTAAQLFDIKGRVALVTGASSGLGLRFAEVLAGEGAPVALVARRADRLAALKARIEAAGGRPHAGAGARAPPPVMIPPVGQNRKALGTVTTLGQK